MTKYEIVKRRNWYYIAKITKDSKGKTIKYYRKGKWISNIIKADSWETWSLANTVLHREVNKR